ncbi:MAG: CbiX/SirB N-terminal domain-containing protein [Cypionkella sp.]|uniref:sirohydrochlorin chelatase n=1 Tax=Cypionkella sp. TaxID=2811411 RepID=UPI002AB9B32E|nr:CbiX/SirB N-terminal domain-containing protein [Cypionkella sp.]MDZ4309545.1 CbiX/SirB N-terminal domain-containing protein [Cypionkella sp.]
MPAVLPPVLIVAHGQPSDPGPAAAELANLTAKVAAHLPSQTIASATLAEPDALAKAIAKLGQGGLLFPLFMAGGWFTRTHLPARLTAAGAQGWQVLEPLGCLASLHALTIKTAAEALQTRAGPIILAAHGSSKSSVPSDIAGHVAAKIRTELGCEVHVAFIDQTPQLKDLPAIGDHAICLPFFAASGGHVTTDIPEALASAGFSGTLLAALGLRLEIPALIAEAIRAASPVCTQDCRYKRG